MSVHFSVTSCTFLPAEFNAKCLHLDEKFLKLVLKCQSQLTVALKIGRAGTRSLYLDVDDFVPDKGLQKYADQPHKP